MTAVLHTIQRVFPGVLRMSLSASWLVLAVLLLRVVLRRAPKWTHCLLWALVAVRLVCPLLPESDVSLMPQIAAPAYSEEQTISAALDGNLPVLEFETPRDQAVNHAAEEAGSNARIGNSAAPSEYLPFVWAAGVLAMLLYALVSYLRLRRRVAPSIPLQGNVRRCDYIDTPFILGVFAPRVYVPSDLTGPQLAHVLAHERAHLARHDHWWKPFAFTLLSVYWFNPALWLSYVLLCRDIELACDERVYRDMALAERADYSQTLLDQSCSRFRVAACPLAFGEVSVKTRVRAALNYKKPAFWVLLAAVLACAAAAVCFLTNPASLPVDFTEEDVERVSAYHKETVEDVGVRQLDGVTGELCERLTALRGLRRGDYAGMTPMYTLTLSLTNGEELKINGYNTNGLFTEIAYRGRTWRVGDDAFGRYVMALCRGTDWETGLSAALVDDWTRWDAMDEQSRMLSSALPGHLTRELDDWAEAAAFAGIPGWNPLEGAAWLVRANYAGASLTAAQTERARHHVMLTWSGSRNGTVESKQLTAGYADGGVRVMLSAGYGMPEESFDRETQLTLSDGTPARCGYASGELWDAASLIFVRGGASYTARVVSNEGLQARDATLERVIAALGGAGAQNDRWAADLDGDGTAEYLTADLAALAAGEAAQLRLLDAAGEPLCDLGTISTAHAGWRTLALTELDGRTYLLEYGPTMFQGEASYFYDLMELDDGVLRIVEHRSAAFSVNPGKTADNDTEAMRLFRQRANELWSASRLLLTTDQEVLTHLYDAAGNAVSDGGRGYCAAGATEVLRYRETMQALTGALIVEYDDEMLSQSDLDALGKEYGFTAVRNFGRGDLFSAYFDAPLTRAEAEAFMERFSKEAGILRVFSGETILPSGVFDVLGFTGVVRTEQETAPGHGFRSYFAQIGNEAVQVAESFGFAIDDHVVDLDGDGVTELVCNCVFGGDGARRVYVYRRNGALIERGSIVYDRLDLTAWDNWGANSTAEWYDPESGKILVEYASPASSTRSGTFIREADYAALAWEEYADVSGSAAEIPVAAQPYHFTAEIVGYGNDTLLVQITDPGDSGMPTGRKLYVPAAESYDAYPVGAAFEFTCTGAIGLDDNGDYGVDRPISVVPKTPSATRTAAVLPAPAAEAPAPDEDGEPLTEPDDSMVVVIDLNDYEGGV